MTVLRALASRYESMASEGNAPLPGFGPARISLTIVVSSKGDLVSAEDERTGKGQLLRPKVVEAPLAPKRTLGVSSGAFWDTTAYVLGRTAIDSTADRRRQVRESARTAEKHAAFKTRHDSLLEGTTDAGCKALLTFLRR